MNHEEDVRAGGELLGNFAKAPEEARYGHETTSG